VVFLGTSLTAGLGVPYDAAFPALIQQRIDALGLRFRVVNAGVSGDTSAGGLRRIDWLLREPISVLVLELGANDMLRGQDLAALRANLQQIIDRTRARYPAARVVIAGMQSAPNLGDAYALPFARTFADLARENRAALIPFLLEGVAAVPGLNQGDGIHPNAEGHRVIAANVWRELEPVLRELRELRELQPPPL
jgi:acyl-CoA thioesterase-1